MGCKYAVFPQNTELDHKKKYKTKSVFSVYDNHERFVFWGDTNNLRAVLDLELQPAECQNIQHRQRQL